MDDDSPAPTDPAKPTEQDLLRARRDLAAEEAQKDRKAAKERATEHFTESVADAMRSLRRAQKAHRENDKTRVEDHLKAARMSLKAADDAVRRWGWP